MKKITLKVLFFIRGIIENTIDKIDDQALIEFEIKRLELTNDYQSIPDNIHLTMESFNEMIESINKSYSK